MKDTVLGIQFDVNDLDAKYEVVGTSDNYSFQYNLGLGSDLVTEVGDQAQRAISLQGNYGDFTVRVFAVSDIGVRSAFVESGIRINPSEFDGTFKFANIFYVISKSTLVSTVYLYYYATSKLSYNIIILTSLLFLFPVK